jgi:hypothetical protein
MYNINQIMLSMEVRSYMKRLRLEKDYLALFHNYFPARFTSLALQNYKSSLWLLWKHFYKIYLNNSLIKGKR